MTLAEVQVACVAVFRLLLAGESDSHAKAWGESKKLGTGEGGGEERKRYFRHILFNTKEELKYGTFAETSW